MRRRLFGSKPPLLVKYNEVIRESKNTFAYATFEFDLSGMRPRAGYTPYLLCDWLPNPETSYDWYDTEVYGWEGSYGFLYSTEYYSTDEIILSMNTEYHGEYIFNHKVYHQWEGKGYSPYYIYGQAWPLSAFKGYEDNKLKFRLGRYSYSESYVAGYNSHKHHFYFFIREHPEIYQIIDVKI